MQANAAPPSEPLPTNIRRTFAIRPAVLRRARSRPSLDQLPPSPPSRSNSWKRRKAPARLELTRDSANVGTSSAASTPTSTHIAATQRQTGVPLVRTDTLDSLASSVLEFAAPPVSSSGGMVGRYQSTLAQDPDEPVALEDENWALAFEPRRSGSWRKMARRLGIGTDTPFPAPSSSVPHPPTVPEQAPPPLPTRSPARITRQSRRWSISSFASSMHDNRMAANTGSSDESGAETETEQGHEESYERHRDEKPKHPISDCNDSQDGAMLVVPSNAATMLRAEYWSPPRLLSGSRDKGKTYNTVGAQSWYGEWNRRDIRDVISSLRELK
ncbi:hypothetical protein MKEN_00999900 [Mycena kentingensis (nom. inval.)]|nr:hypothetical protein MKEN_00999900 [Mycena kentingensis (nom. inval.)]